MGDIANMMITGIMCEMCGTYLECDTCEEIGVPAYCSRVCAYNRGRDQEAVCNH